MGTCFSTSESRELYKMSPIKNSMSTSAVLTGLKPLTHGPGSGPYGNSNNSYLVPNPVRSAPKRMFSLQQSLPRLPVPPLQQTIDRYLLSMAPILSEEEMKRAKKLTDELLVPGSAGDQLQKALEQRARDKVNWLEEWWLNCAYLEYRLPCPIHVNPGVTFGNENFKTVDDQLRYAAKLVAGVLDYKCMVDDQTLPVEYMGKKPLCMSQYFKILSACRIPKYGRDSVVVFPPDQMNPPKHITVLRNNNIFSLQVYGSDNIPLTEEQLFDRLKDIQSRSEMAGTPIGILTSDERDVWAKNYDLLVRDPHNKAQMEEIQRSIFALCLDRKSPRSSDWSQETVNARVMNHGGGSDYNSANRWFDKTLQFIVCQDGAVGLNYEHSTAEGPPIISLCDHTLTYLGRDHGYQTPVRGVQPAKHLEFNVSDEISTAIYNASHNFDKTINNLRMNAFSVKDFGKDFIKSHKMSPDGFIQVALQLTYYKLHKRNTTTYESGSLRQFQNGRTDTIRSCTLATDKYVKAMCDASTTMEQKATLLREAVQQHRLYTNAVISGQGIDRHLLGLKLISKDANVDLPAFFNDPIYSKSFHFSVSTSQVPSRYDLLLCFGPVVDDGYGICYNPMPQYVNFCVSSWDDCSETDGDLFVEELKKSLNDASQLLIKTQKSNL